MDKLYSDYALLQNEIEALERRKENMRTTILEGIMATGMEKVETSVGNFTVANKVKWTYSPAVTALEEKVKIKKIMEQKKGTAEASKSQYLLFSPLKI